MADERTVEQIERDLAQTRQRLAENLSTLISEVHPKAVVHRTVDQSKRRARQALADGQRKARESLDQVTSYFRHETGWRTDRLAIAGAAAAVVVTVVALVASRK